MKGNIPKLLWTPTKSFKDDANMSHYITWLNQSFSLGISDYQTLWQWSVDNTDLFWQSILEYFSVSYDGKYSSVLNTTDMPGCEWFAGIQLNYAEHIFKGQSAFPAIIFKSEASEIIEISWPELSEKVARIQDFLISRGIKQGDRVAAYLPNIPEAIIAFLAVNSIGAIWSSTSPDFGTQSVIDRIAQIEPALLIAVDQYQYGGKKFDRSKALDEITKNIASIHTVLVVNPTAKWSTTEKRAFIDWSSIPGTGKLKPDFTRVDFSHPIWVLYSSGTTGIPKAITHSQGGILLEHLKYLSFHNNVKSSDRCFWYTTTGWMMWNYIQASLLCGGTVVLYDGSPAYPDLNVLWQLAEKVKITHFGTSAGFVVANMKADLHPGTDFNLSHLQSIGSTGSPLPPEGFDWIYQSVKKDLWLASISGGTDVCSAFVGGNPLWPVYEGEIQCRALGCKLEAYDESGKPLANHMGEMVISKPMPSMPIYFWNDPDQQRYKESYFEMYPGVWRHGDWTEITDRQGIIIYGRSDATLNRGGIRIGTGEIYRAVDTIEEVADSLVVYLDSPHDYMPLFVKMNHGFELTDALIKKIKTTIRSNFTPRHVPDEVLAVKEIPYTISGKKMETPVKKILMGRDISGVINQDAMRNPQALAYFTILAKKINNHLG